MSNATVPANVVTDWVEAYQRQHQLRSGLNYPCETLIRLFKGVFVTGEPLPTQNKRLLDIGFGNGNNTLFFAQLGLDVAGVEIDESICELARQDFEALGLPAEFKAGSNQHIPYEDNSFDYLVSWNVLHYEGSRETVERSITEAARVLKPGGRLILSTTGPNHRILKNSTALGEHRYQLNYPGDFRQNEVHYFMETEEHLLALFAPHFTELKPGRILDYLFTEQLDWFLLTGLVKK